MILNKNVKETDSFLDVNNDIYRMITVFNNCQELKRLLVYTDRKPLERKEDVTADLRDKQIARVPLLPYDEEEGSLVVITVISGDESPTSDILHPTLAIDIFFFFSSRRRHTRYRYVTGVQTVCSSDLVLSLC